MRKFLVVLDDSRECLNAMRFAALRAAHTGGGVTILSIIPPEEYQHWMGVADLMRQEARERIEAHFEVFAKWMRDKQGINPELIIREGDPVVEILAQVNDDPSVGVLVLGGGGPGDGPCWSPPPQHIPYFLGLIRSIFHSCKYPLGSCVRITFLSTDSEEGLSGSFALLLY